MRHTARIDGIDVARGLAGLIMIGGHATHAWVVPDERSSVGYAITRLFGTLPLPAFLVLAGAAVMWRVDAAARRGEDARDVRHRVAWRGLQIVLSGYAVSALYALMDGTRGIDGLLRADVLHVIGLSIAAVAWLGIRATAPGGAPSRPRLVSTALVLAVAVTVLCPLVSQIAPHTPGPLRFVVALFGDVPGVTLMPLVPLSAWLCAGTLAAAIMLRARERAADTSARGAPIATLVAIAGAALATATIAHALTPTSLTRQSPAIALNVLDLAARGLLVLAAGALLTGVLRGAPRAILLRLGRGSLVAYVFHIPFCYGALGRPFAQKLTLLESLAGFVVLAAASYLAVWARDTLRDRFTRGDTAARARILRPRTRPHAAPKVDPAPPRE